MNKDSKIVVQKYGGSSLSHPNAIKKVASLIKNRTIYNKKICVIVSAMGETTNQLLSLANKISNNPSHRELDMLLSCGERISISLLSIALNEIGIPSISFTGSQSGIITDNKHCIANIIELQPFRVKEELNKNKVVIIAGFQGISKKKEITTLGRGGSDITAIAMTAALNAEICEIYSDVNGIYSADPKLVKTAKFFETLSYEQMHELSISGANVLHHQAVSLAKKKGIIIHARKTGSSNTGTIICNKKSSKQSVLGIIHRKNIF